MLICVFSDMCAVIINLLVRLGRAHAWMGVVWYVLSRVHVSLVYFLGSSLRYRLYIFTSDISRLYTFSLYIFLLYKFSRCILRAVRQSRPDSYMYVYANASCMRMQFARVLGRSVRCGCGLHAAHVRHAALLLCIVCPPASATCALLLCTLLQFPDLGAADAVQCQQSCAWMYVCVRMREHVCVCLFVCMCVYVARANSRVHVRVRSA
jgi:hypothetical protein